MKYKEKNVPSREEEAIFEQGKPEGEDAGRWRQKLESREKKLKYLQTAERYWYGKDWYGSEKRKTPA
ncbi:hypothetical protein M1N57_01400 [Dehalococcoidales bacterium]|nr:hypothetical protein [Dehalococcoidales bacterium]